MINLLCLFLPPQLTVGLAACVGLSIAPAFTNSHPWGWTPGSAPSQATAAMVDRRRN